MTDLARRCPSLAASVDAILNNGEEIHFENEIEDVAFAYFVVKKCAESADDMIEYNIASLYHGGSMSEALEIFVSLFLEPLYEYIDEQLDDQRAVLALLRRYKHKCEWFQRDHLYKMWESDTQSGEMSLALHLYEYLHDQGLDFTIEPWSVSGEADWVAAQGSEDPLIADVKIFSPERSKGRNYIAKGFNQIYQYTLDYSEPFGYLIIFKICEQDLKLALPYQALSTSFLVHNGRTIFMLVIDIYPHKAPASKRGIVKATEITEQDLVHIAKAK